MSEDTTVTLYRPVGPKELALIEASGYSTYPPRLDWQPIFYPVLNEEYAIQIAREWNVKQSGAGYVTRFRVRSAFIARYEVQTVGARMHQGDVALGQRHGDAGGDQRPLPRREGHVDGGHQVGTGVPGVGVGRQRQLGVESLHLDVEMLRGGHPADPTGRPRTAQ